MFLCHTSRSLRRRLSLSQLSPLGSGSAYGLASRVSCACSLSPSTCELCVSLSFRISSSRLTSRPAGASGVSTRHPLVKLQVRQDRSKTDRCWRSGRTVGCIVLVLGVGRCTFRPPRVVFVFRPCAFNRFSHFWQKRINKKKRKNSTLQA